MSQAQQYLARVIAWPKEGEPPAYVNLHWTFMPKDGLRPGQTKLPWTGRATRSLGEAMQTVAWAASLPDTRDIYMCMSTQLAAQETTSRTGRQYLKPVRLAENAAAIKALWLDIDAKEGDTGYPSVEAAAAALAQFVKDTGLPPVSMAVASGNGLHAYWTFKSALTAHQWYPLATALVEATKRHGLKCDTMVTTDAARVLRVPDTFNYKTTPPHHVRMLVERDDYNAEDIEKVLAPYKVAGNFLADSNVLSVFENPAAFTRRAPLAGKSDLSGGIETAMPRDQVRKCLDAIPNNKVDWNFWNATGMRVYAATEGADYGLEEWKRWSATNQAVAQATDDCDSRWQTLHGSPPERTGAGALVKQAREALGDPQWRPYTPAAAQAGLQPPGHGQVTPGVTGFGAPPPNNNDLPNGYSRDARGIISVLAQDDLGGSSLEPVSDYPMTDPMLQKDPWIFHFTTVTDNGRRQRIALDVTHVGNSLEMKRLLQGQGMMVRSQKLMGDFLMSWIRKLQSTKDAVTSSPFGWSSKGNNIEGFVYGGKMHTPNGETPAADPDPVLAEQYSPVGDLQPWLDAAKMVTSQDRPDLNALIASAFAAPLVRFTGHRGLLLSTYSIESGIGKTTAVNIAQAVWGSPVMATSTLNDTENSVMNKVGQIRALPLYWDELKTEDDTRRFTNIAFRLTMGKEKARLGQTAKQKRPGQWQTLMVAASNESLLDYIISRTLTTTAGLYRCFEFEVKPNKAAQGVSSVVTRMVAKLNESYGNAGLVYSEFLGKNFTAIDTEVGKFTEELEKKVKANPDERFWVSLVALIILGAKYANQLQLTTIDLEQLTDFMLDKLEAMRGERTSQIVDLRDAGNVSSQLAQFLKAAQGRHTLRTNRVHITAGKPAPNAIKVVGDVSRLDGVQVQMGMDDKIMRISMAYMRQWLEDNGISKNNFLKAMEQEFNSRPVKGRLGSGTQYATSTENLIELQLSGTKLANYFEV